MIIRLSRYGIAIFTTLFIFFPTTLPAKGLSLKRVVMKRPMINHIKKVEKKAKKRTWQKAAVLRHGVNLSIRPLTENSRWHNLPINGSRLTTLDPEEIVLDIMDFGSSGELASLNQCLEDNNETSASGSTIESIISGEEPPDCVHDEINMSPGVENEFLSGLGSMSGSPYRQMANCVAQSRQDLIEMSAFAACINRENERRRFGIVGGEKQFVSPDETGQVSDGGSVIQNVVDVNNDGDWAISGCGSVGNSGGCGGMRFNNNGSITFFGGPLGGGGGSITVGGSTSREEAPPPSTFTGQQPKLTADDYLAVSDYAGSVLRGSSDNDDDDDVVSSDSSASGDPKTTMPFEPEGTGNPMIDRCWEEAQRELGREELQRMINQGEIPGSLGPLIMPDPDSPGSADPVFLTCTTAISSGSSDNNGCPEDQTAYPDPNGPGTLCADPYGISSDSTNYNGPDGWTDPSDGETPSGGGSVINPYCHLHPEDPSCADPGA